MSRLTFSSFWEWFIRYSKKITYDQQEILFEKLFFVYYNRPDIKTPDKSRISQYKNGATLPKELINTYYPGTEYREELRDAIKKYIRPNITAWPAAGEVLYTIVKDDQMIPRPEWEKLMNDCVLEGGDATVEWLTDVLICAIVPRELPSVANTLRMVSINHIPKPCDWFVGRDDEIVELDNKLRTCKKVFLCGIPGIGKSELAKKYVAEHGAKYTEVLWIPCQDSLRKSIVSVELERDRVDDDDETRFRNHMYALKHLPQGALAVLDNCNWLPENEPMLNEILACRCHVLVTTRACLEEQIYLEVQELAQTDLVKLINCFCKNKNYPDRDLQMLIRKLHRHTFAVELAARMVSKKKPTPRELLVKLSLSRLARKVFKKNVTSHKDNATKRATYYQTMSDLFMLMDLDPDKQDLLRNMTLMPDAGVYLDDLLMLLGLRDDGTVEDLVRMGLLRWDEEADVVEMLPMVRDMTLEDIPPSVRKCDVLIDRVAQLLSEYGADDPCLPLLDMIVERIAKEAEKDDPDRYWALLCNAVNAMEGIGQKDAMKRILRDMERFGRAYTTSATKTAEYLDLKACLVDDNRKRVMLEEKALRALEQDGAGDSELARNICNNLAGAYRQTYQYEKAAVMLEKRLAQITQEEGNPLRHNYLTCVCNLAMTYAEMGDPAKALGLVDPVERELRVKQDCGSEYAVVLETLGHIHMLSGRMSLAIDRYEQALSVWIDLKGWQSQVVREKASEYSQLIRQFGYDAAGKAERITHTAV